MNASKMKKQKKSEITGPDSLANRVIVHVDADCFAVQLLTKDDPSIQNKPVIVTNDHVIMSTNYPAREFGISKQDSIKEAFEKCPDLIRKRVPDRWGKCDLRSARLASYSFFDCINKFRREQDTEIPTDFCGKEEFYMDISKLVTKRHLLTLTTNFTMKTILESSDCLVLDTFEGPLLCDNFKKQDWHLVIGGMIVMEIVQRLKSETGFQFSAGVSTSKLLATLACEMNKPATVTILTDEGLSRLASQIKIENIRHLGGKMGQQLKNEFNVDTMEKLQLIPKNVLENRFGSKNGSLCHRLAFGVDKEQVKETVLKPSIQCSINLCGREGVRTLRDLQDLKTVLHHLAEEMVEWLEEERIRNKRRTGLLSVNLSRPITSSSTDENNVPYYCSFQCSDNLTDKGIVTKSLELLQNIWDKHGMPHFTDLTQVKIIAKNFVFLTEETRIKSLSFLSVDIP